MLELPNAVIYQLKITLRGISPLIWRRLLVRAETSILAEAKTVLARLQQRLVEQQAAEYLWAQSRCPHCGTKRSHKGAHTITLRTLFGKLRLNSPRLYHCQCQRHPARTFSPLAERLPERNTPELLYLETKWASLMSYGMTSKLLDEVLPIGKHINAATVRN